MILNLKYYYFSFKIKKIYILKKKLIYCCLNYENQIKIILNIYIF
jgi:hypothetical protein